jgi:hypothetical protein
MITRQFCLPTPNYTVLLTATSFYFGGAGTAQVTRDAQALFLPEFLSEELALVSYVYSSENTPDWGMGEKGDALRRIVLELAILHIDHFNGNVEFERQLDEEVQFAVGKVRCLNQKRHKGEGGYRLLRTR